MITYSTNWMGPVSLRWYSERGISPDVHYSCGRIDMQDSDIEGYAGWDEYTLAPMISEDFNALSDFLYGFETEERIPYDELIELFETEYGKKIRWASD